MRTIRAAVISMTCLLAMSLPAPPAFAATIIVNTTADEYGSGASCSLREAIESANQNSAFGGCIAGSNGDVIQVPPGTYSLTLSGDDDVNAVGDLDLDSSPITITGSGAASTIVNGNGIDRVFELAAGDQATITDLTVRGGMINEGGGGIYSSGTLTLARVAVVDNAGTYGGGIATWPAAARLTITDSLVAGNDTDPSDGVGGGVSVESDGTVLTNVTVSGNLGHDRGGGIWVEDNAEATLNNLTIVGNTGDATPEAEGGGGIAVDPSGAVTVRNTIIAKNVDGDGTAPDCVGPVTSQGHNIVGTTTGCTFASATGDKPNQDPLTGPLADNGGPTMTHALLPGSPAIDGGDPATPGSGGTACAETDQRGAPRNCDIGAYELVVCKGVTVNRVGSAANDSLTGTTGADGFLGQTGNDTMSGGAGKDALCGGAGKDRLKGQGGTDKLFGEAGKDKLIGGPGKRDVCNGGPGNDSAKGSCEKERKL